MSGPIRRLNEHGRARFRAWLEGGAAGAPPLELLDDPASSVPLHPSIPRPNRRYDRRYDLGVDLVDRLADIDTAPLQIDADLWDWLSLCLIDQLCPVNEAGRRKPDRIDRYILQLDNHRTRYRHLVRTAWSLVRVHEAAALFMLAAPLHVHGEAAEQLGAYQDVITCRPLIAAIGSLVWDEDAGRLTRGFSGRRAGSARRVPVVAKQFRLTYDLDSMTPEQILALLPREFDRFRSPGATSRAGRAPRPDLTRQEQRPEAGSA